MKPINLNNTCVLILQAVVNCQVTASVGLGGGAGVTVGVGQPESQSESQPESQPQAQMQNQNQNNVDYEAEAFFNIDQLSYVCLDAMNNIDTVLNDAWKQGIVISDVELMLLQVTFHMCGVQRDTYNYYLSQVTVANGSSNSQQQQQN